MKRSTIWILTAVMAITIIGLLAVEIVYMENMVKMRNEQFSEGVMRSLYRVTTMLEQNETKYYLDQDLADAAAIYGSQFKGSGKYDFGGGDMMGVDTAAIADSHASTGRPANFNNLKNLYTSLIIQSSCWLVRQDYSWILYESSRNRNSLLLTT